MKAPLSFVPWMGAFFAAGAALTTQSIAHAQSCSADADCGDGFTCKTESYQSCSGGVMCSDDGECEEVDVVCETNEHSYCVNDTCASQADCPSFMACQPQTNWVCEGGGYAGASGAGGVSGAGGFPGMGPCDPDGNCEEPPTCEEVPADSLCIPRYQLPCEVAADCGGGFACVESYYWTCMGGGSAGMGAGGAPAEDAGVGEEVVCEQIPSGESYCELQVVPCEASSDCPEGLECLEQYIYGPCSGGGVGGYGGAAGTGASGAGGLGGGMDAPGDGDGDGDGMPVDAGAGEEYYCPEPVVELRCMPPSYGGGGAGMGGAGGTGGGVSDGGVEEPPTDPGQGSGSAGMAAAGAGGAGGGGGASEDSDNESDEHRGRGRGLLRKLLGCSASGPVGGGTQSMAWLLMGVTALFLTRRARKS